jgi:penicillin-binding protein 2
MMLVRREADDIREIRPRAALGALVVVCAMLVLVVRLYQLQIVRGDEYVAQSLSNFRKSLPVPADRGVIKDRLGRVLVDNRPSFDVYLTPAFCRGKEKDEVMARLATYLKMPAEDLERMRREYARAVAAPREQLETSKPYLVALDIPRDGVDVLEAHRNELSCVDLIPSPHRAYRVGQSLGHVLGYMSEVTPDELDEHSEEHSDYHRGQTIGRRGIERRWEQELRGKDGKEAFAVDAKGRRLDETMNELLIPPDERLVPASSGNNLVLSLDTELQEAADKAFPGRAGGVIVMEAQTGFILAMISRPSFDPNQMSGRISRSEMARLFSDPLKPMINRVMNENYHPGSTFKVVTSLAALEKGLLKQSGTIGCNGGYTLGNHRWRCDKASGHGFLTVKSALQYSCDVFFYTLGDRLGIDPIAEMAHKLGYGQPTGLDLGRDIPGVIPDSQSLIKAEGTYQKYHAINASIGQGDVNVTPLQQAVAYAAIGNGGTIFRPQLVRRIESPEGKVLREFAPQIVAKLGIKPQNLAVVQAGLTAVVNEPGGTAYRSRLSDVIFAGKTGTAQVVKLGSKQKLDPTQTAYMSRDHAWFAAFAPAVKPEIVVVVVSEHGGWGADAAAPAASKIVEAYFALKKDKEQEIARASKTLPPVLVPRVAVAALPPEPPIAVELSSPAPDVNWALQKRRGARSAGTEAQAAERPLAPAAADGDESGAPEDEETAEASAEAPAEAPAQAPPGHAEAEPRLAQPAAAPPEPAPAGAPLAQTPQEGQARPAAQESQAAQDPPAEPADAPVPAKAQGGPQPPVQVQVQAPGETPPETKAASLAPPAEGN